MSYVRIIGNLSKAQAIRSNTKKKLHKFLASPEIWILKIGSLSVWFIHGRLARIKSVTHWELGETLSEHRHVILQYNIML